MPLPLLPTIAAIATPPGLGGVAIVRVSGPHALDLMQKLFKKSSTEEEDYPRPRVLYFGHIWDKDTLLDEGLCVFMKGPSSYTGEDVTEFHVHGGSLTAKRVLESCIRQGARLSQPGEFTKRRFLNGKMDLSQAEAVMDVIHAATDFSLKASLAQLQGALGQRINALQDKLTDVMAELSVCFDYPEEDIEQLTVQKIKNVLNDILAKGQELLKDARTGLILREGLKLCLAGRPNVGKSSLFNALLACDRAIVTPIPGTTRDVLEENLDIDGLWVRLKDTAGIHESPDQVEAIGIARAKESLKEADLVLFVLDASETLTPKDLTLCEILKDKNVFAILNKSDLPPVIFPSEISAILPCAKIFNLSCQSGEGIAFLKQAIFRFAMGNLNHAPEALLTQSRHIEAMEMALSYLSHALEGAEEGFTPDALAVDIQNAWYALGLITGVSADESIFDRVFERFCLGK